MAIRTRKPRHDLGPRRRPKTTEGEAIVGAILDATKHLLAEHGFAHLTTNRVADRAGVSIGSLYQYFTDKESIVAALGRRFDEQALDIIEKTVIGETRSMRDDIRALVTVLVAIERGDQRMRRSLLREVPRSWIEVPGAELEQRTRAVVEHMFERWPAKRQRVTPATAAFIAYHAITSVIEAALLQQPELLAQERFSRELERLVLSYLELEPEGA